MIFCSGRMPEQKTSSSRSDGVFLFFSRLIAKKEKFLSILYILSGLFPVSSVRPVSGSPGLPSVPSGLSCLTLSPLHQCEASIVH